MSITFPTFIDKEIVTPEKLNDFVQALEAKFAAGLSSAEIQWDLVAAGNLVMGSNHITGSRTIWGIHNADEYDDDWDACVLAGVSGCIVIPPNTTVAMDGSDMTGSSLTIRGSGPSSVLQLEAGASAGYALRNTAADFSLNIQDVTIDGADIASQIGLQLKGAKEIIITGCVFKDFGDTAIQLLKLSTSACRSIRITNNRFEGGASHFIEGTAVQDIVITDNVFATAAKTAIYMKAGSATALINNVDVSDNVFNNCTSDIINIDGYDGSFNAYQSHIKVSGNIGDSTNSIKVGSANGKVQYVNISDNIVPGSYADGLNVCAKFGVVSGNVMTDATSDGCDMLASQDLVVKGNNFHSAGAAGIRFVDAEDCIITDNNCWDCVPSVIVNDSTDTSPCKHYGNSDTAPEALPLSGYFCNAESFVLPANTLQVGDILEIQAAWVNATGAETQGIMFDGQYVADMYAVGAGDKAGGIVSIFITGTTTIEWAGSAWADAGIVNNVEGESGGHTLTGTMVVKINSAASSNEKIFVRHRRGVDATP